MPARTRSPHDNGVVNIVPRGRRPLRFLVDAAVLVGLVVAIVVALVLSHDQMSTVTRWIFVIALVMTVQGLANTISVPTIDQSGFTIRYGPWTRTIRPERVTSITYQPLTRTFMVRERYTVFGYRLAPPNFVDPDAISNDVREWARTNSVPIRG